MSKSCDCDQLLSGVLFFSFCTFIIHMEIIICAENSIKPENLESKLFSGKLYDKYLINFNNDEMNCIEELFKEVDKEKKYYDISQIVVKVINSVSMALNVGIFIYTLTMIYCLIKFKSLLFIVPV